MKICEFSVKRKVTTSMFFLAVLLIAIVALYRLPLEFLPAMNNPWLSVFVPYSGSSPREVEKLITRPLEEVLSTIPGIKRVESTSSDTGCFINLNLKYGLNLDYKGQEILDKIDSHKDSLPEETGRINIWKMSTNSMPVQFIAVAGGNERDSVSVIVEKRFIPELMRIKGVAKVDVRGLRKKEILVEMSSDNMEKYSVTPFLVRQAVAASLNNHEIGQIYESGSSLGIRLDARVANPFEIEDLLIKEGVRLRDVGSVTWDYPEIDSDLRIDSAPAFILTIFKESSANVVDTCQRVREKLEQLKADKIFSKMSTKSFFDQGSVIEKTLEGLKKAGLYGALLAVVILFVFLRKVSATLIVALSIPFSLLMTVVFFFFWDISFNIISMSGLIIGIGMLVDNAIVVIEAVTRRVEDGISPIKAAYKGASEVGIAVSCSTLTTVIVFLPLAFTIQSEASSYVREFGLSISFSLIASLFVSLTLIPLLSSFFISPSAGKKGVEQSFLSRGYARVLDQVLINPFLWFFIISALIYYTFTNISGYIGKSGMVQMGQRRYKMRVKTPDFWDFKKTDQFYRNLEKKLVKKKEELNLLVVSVRLSQGSGRFSFFMNEEEDGGVSMEDSKKMLREFLPENSPGVEFRISGEGYIGGAGGSGTISVSLAAEESGILEPYIEEFADQIRLISNVTSVSTDFEEGKKEMIFEPDLEICENYGVDPSSIGQYVSFSSRGTRAGWFNTPTGEFPVKLRMARDDVRDSSQLKKFLIPSKQQDSKGIPLEHLVRMKYSNSPMEIRRKNGKVSMSVNIECPTDKLSTIRKEVQSISNKISLPKGCEISFGQSFEQTDEAMNVIFSTLGIAFLLIYLIMASLFESLLYPFIIIFTFPFGAFGVIWTLFLTDTPFDLMSGCGALILAGIVVNNAIVLIDSINNLRKTGMDDKKALILASVLRLRPILMTGLTTIFGLIPMLGGQTEASKIYSGLAKAVMGGLFTSIVLTIIFIPVVFTVSEKSVAFIKGLVLTVFFKKGVETDNS